MTLTLNLYLHLAQTILKAVLRNFPEIVLEEIERQKRRRSKPRQTD